MSTGVNAVLLFHKKLDMDHSHDLFVRGSHTDPNHELVFEVMNEGAFGSLEFLCERWGVEFMIKSVGEWIHKSEPCQLAELKRWLKKRSNLWEDTRSEKTVRARAVIMDWNAACSKANV